MNIKRTSFYDTYSYNIGGINYTLNDIEVIKFIHNNIYWRERGGAGGGINIVYLNIYF